MAILVSGMGGAEKVKINDEKVKEKMELFTHNSPIPIQKVSKSNLITRQDINFDGGKVIYQIDNRYFIKAISGTGEISLPQLFSLKYCENNQEYYAYRTDKTDFNLYRLGCDWILPNFSWQVIVQNLNLQNFIMEQIPNINSYYLDIGNFILYNDLIFFTSIYQKEGSNKIYNGLFKFNIETNVLNIIQITEEGHGYAGNDLSKLSIIDTTLYYFPASIYAERYNAMYVYDIENETISERYNFDNISSDRYSILGTFINNKFQLNLVIGYNNELKIYNLQKDNEQYSWNLLSSFNYASATISYFNNNIPILVYNQDSKKYVEFSFDTYEYKEIIIDTDSNDYILFLNNFINGVMSEDFVDITRYNGYFKTDNYTYSSYYHIENYEPNHGFVSTYYQCWLPLQQNIKNIATYKLPGFYYDNFNLQSHIDNMIFIEETV